MRPRAIFTAVALVALFALPRLAGAVAVHTFDCKNCHIPALTTTDLGDGNVCLSCHYREQSVLLNDGRTGTTNSAFSGSDASNAMGNNPTDNSRQTSHNWGAPDNQPTAAGAVAPSRTTYPEFYSRQGASHGRVTCSRCHNPHAETTNPQLLVKGAGSAETMCIACHANWNQDNVTNVTHVTHPINFDYATAVADHPGKYQPVTSLPVNDNNINTPTPISLTGGKVVCSTCHQVHFADSDPTTLDTPAEWDNLNAGDGKLLRTYGRVAPTANTATAFYNSAVLSSELCQTCHIYETHGSTHATLGCLDCHGGHAKSGNYYMLRPQVTDIYLPKDSAYDQNSGPLAYVTTTAYWKNGGTGYCEGCHVIPTTVTQHNVATAGAVECAGCHNHTGDSFTSTCNGCHGYAPTTNTAGGPTGYAVTTSAPIYNYSLNGAYKDESQTPHKRHAGGSSDYSFSCNQCHYTVTDVDTAPHKDGNFQNVGFTDAGIIAKTDGAAPAYTTTGNGSCATTYCHSNGGPRSLGAMKYPATAPVWGGGVGDITTCDVCHGNSAATMAAGDRNNSATHIVHLNKTYACNACHSQTATSNTALVTAGGDHVDGQADVLFDENYDLNGAATGGALGNAGNSYGSDGSCTVYCHSNGKGAVVQAPNWDLANTGDCGDCHAVAAGAGLLGAHDKHLNLGFGCETCHPAGSATGSHTAHVNRVIDKPDMAVCNACHGATAAVTTGNDREPIWTSAASVDCATCHVGTAISVINYGSGNKTAPAKQDFYTTGHGKGSFPANSPECNECHDANAAGHFDGTSGDDDRLIAAATCESCHGAAGSATTKNGIYTHQGNTCVTCHDPHGSSNLDMVRATSAAYSGTVVFTATTGANSYDEDDGADGGVTESNADDICATCHSSAAGTSHNNRQNTDSQAPTGHKLGQNCFSCHKAHTDATAPFGMGAGTACDDCHGFPPDTAAHKLHAPDSFALDALGSINKDTVDRSACEHCHTGAASYTYDLTADNGGGLNHGNAAGRETLLTASVGYSATNFNCATACHASTVADGVWSDTALNCDSCHGGLKTDVATISSGKHTKHLAVAANNCNTCHDAAIPTDTAHITDRTGANEIAKVTGMADALADEANVLVTTWDDTENTCANAACHNPSNDTHKADWDTSTSSCTLCHGDDATMSSNKHGQHLGSGIAMSCNNCHVDNGTNNAHLDGTKQVTGTSISSWTTPNCANVCHVTSASNWTSGTLTCVDCHTTGKTGLYDSGARDQAPNSGLHASSNAMAHDVQFLATAAQAAPGTATCTSCHSGTVTSQHINGTGPTAFGAGGITYTFAAGVGYSASGCTATCHSDGGDWTRKWNGVTDAKPLMTDPVNAPVCGNCHGVFGSWRWNEANATTTDHTDPDADNTGDRMADHSQCTTCHVWGQSGYTTTGKHNNGLITMNGPAPATGLGYDNATGGCTVNCHSGKDLTMNSNSGWTADFVDGGPLTCGSCHTGGKTPSSSSGAHDAHGANLADEATCYPCHGDNSGNGYAVYTGSHNTGTVTFATVTYSTATRNDVTGTCLTANCHNYNTGATPDQSAAWNAAALACDDCHYFATGTTPTAAGSNGHARPLSADHGAHFGTGGSFACADCHGTDPTDTTHINGATSLADKAVAAQDEANVVVTTWVDGTDTCSNTACHNPSGTTYSAQWQVSTASCTLCHSATDPGTGSHDEHMNATGTFGINTIACTSCHGTLPVSNAHRNTSIDFAAGMNYTAAATDVGGTLGTCNTATCHNNGLGTPVVTPTWGTGSANCSICHGSSPTTGAHSAHLTAAYGPHPSGSTNCGECHAANANNTSMATYTSHIDGNADFASSTILATTAVCNSCHGNSSGTKGAPITAAKSNWATAASVTCESCHGDYDLAVIGATAPSRAGAAFDLSGHGKVTNNVTYGGNACVNCHNRTSGGHIDGASGDDNRTLTINGKDYAAVPNDYCVACHSGTTKHVHYPNGSTGSSFDGDKCATCHDPHGQNGGMSAMVAGTINGKQVVGFNLADGRARTDYYVDTPNASGNNQYGICQVCHDKNDPQESVDPDGQINYFNTTDPAGTSHNSGGQCNTCHAHTDTPAFKPSGCNGCHGGSYDSATNALDGKNYWPDGIGGNAEDDAGRHQKHISEMAGMVYGESIDQLLTDNTAGNPTLSSDAKQKALCEHCHAAVANDTDHGTSANLPAEVYVAAGGGRHAKNLWGGNDIDAAYATADGGTCATTDCHNNKTTTTVDPNNYSWYGANTSLCIMCHINAPAETTHTAHTSAALTYGRTITCASCHDADTNWSTNTKPTTGHINGAFVVSGNVTFTYGGTYPSTKGSCGTNECHNNGRNGAPANYSDATTYPDYNWATRVNNGCSFCHLHNTNAHNTHFSSGADVGGIFTNSFFSLAGGIGCNACHTHSGNNAVHIDKAITVAGGMTYSSSAASLQVSGTAAPGTCTTTTCHNDGTSNGAGVAVETPLWNRAPSTADSCTLCHSKTTNGVPVTGSHAKHVEGNPAISSYTAQGLTPTSTEYKFDCIDCHGSNLGNHIRGSVNVVVGNWTAQVAGDTCGTNNCHNDGTAAKGAPAQATATWGTAFSGDKCAKCHGNSPTTNAHDVHVVGIHYQDIYSGTSGLLTTATAVRSHGTSTTSTTLNCNTCHSSVVTSASNARHAVCASCHTSGGSAAVGNADAAIADKSKHVDSNRQVAFALTGFNSKAQLRNDITAVSELNSSWTRTTGYKAVAADHDVAKVQASPNDPKWASNSCSNIACHNNIVATWAAPTNNCMACHTQLPR